jgi:hypothetical protein
MTGLATAGGFENAAHDRQSWRAGERGDRRSVLGWPDRLQLIEQPGLPHLPVAFDR